MFERSTLSVLAVGLSVLASATPTYLVLGDSLAFGYILGDVTPSPGLQGYADDVLGAVNAKTGVSHDFLNLAVPQETSVSFGNTDVGIARGLNMNYLAGVLGGTPVSQLSMMQTSVAAIKGAGNTVDYASFAIGANDLLGLTNGGSTIPTQGEIDAVFASALNRYVSVLDYLKGEFPTVHLLRPSYYNPLSTSTLLGAALDPQVENFNTSLKTLAASYGATYIDFYTPIDGNQLSLITPGDIHPNAAGYAVLGQVAAQAVPEPATLCAVALGAAALLRRRRAG
ncbi:SGNH/GDSL hydrolase family protein [bacterium]|nr:MAG: SGNH/GDSL hydrolase family protein [bacterium]